jgi:hypothetical protein
MSANTAGKTTIGHSTADKLVLYGGLPLLGLVLGFFLPRIADWAVKQSWVPMQGPLELIAKWDAWWVVAICTVIGAGAGVVLAAIALEDTLKVTITNSDVEFLKNQKTTRVLRNQVAVAFLEGLRPGRQGQGRPARTPRRGRQARHRRPGQGQEAVLARRAVAACPAGGRGM